MTGPLRVVLIGFGPVGARFADELLPSVAAGRIALTVVGAEAGEPHNRVLVAEYAVGAAELDELVMTDVTRMLEAGADVRCGARAERIDRDTRVVRLTDGHAIPYDRVVLATGARANVPVLDGLRTLGPAADGVDERLTAGVRVLRSADDAEAVREVVASGGSVVVLGAGVLGIELALLLARAGASSSMAHFGPRPMPRSLDAGGGVVLRRALEDCGVRVVPHTRAEAIIVRDDGTGIPRFQALVSSDGKRLDGDLLVLSCGVTPRTEVAQASGLLTDRGVLVDDRLRSWSDPEVHAIGDCAHVADRAAYDRRTAGGPSGLVGPGWRQAEWLAARLRRLAENGAPADEVFAETALEDAATDLVTLKADGVDVVAAGDASADPFTDAEDAEVALWSDPRHGSYVKMVTHGGVLTGFVCVGMPRTAAELSVLYARRGELPADRSLLLRLDAGEASLPRVSGREATLCLCNAVSVGAVEDAVAGGCSTVADVGACTRAGTGCGGCRARIAELLEAVPA